MTKEPHLPVPDPEPDSNWEPRPARCSVAGCRNILVSKSWTEGWCSVHGIVKASYGETQNLEFQKEDEVR